MHLRTVSRARPVRLVSALCAVLVLGACNLLKPYKLDIQQGNVITQEMVDKLRPGMTRSQVRYVLGTPMVVDPFHKERWDYYYSYKKGVEAVPESRRLTLLFRDDVLHSIQGDVATRPTETAPASDKPTP